MPATNIPEIRTLIEASLQALTPEVLPEVPFKVSSPSATIDRQIFGDRHDACRRFQLTFGPLGGFVGAQILNWNGSLVRLKDTLEIKVRYEFGNDDGGFQMLADMVASDQQLLIRQVHPLVTLGLEDYIHEIYPNGTVNLNDLTDKEASYSCYIFSIQFDFLTSLGDI
jgi:hypothetical protein